MDSQQNQGSQNKSEPKKQINWLVVSTHGKKHARQIGSFPQIGMNIKYIFKKQIPRTPGAYPLRPPSNSLFQEILLFGA